MTISVKPIVVTCPICYLPLENKRGTVECAKNHSFDVSREGYVNLLITNSAKQRGDNKAMVQARQSFLDAGYYQPLSNQLNKLVFDLFSHQEKQHHIVDAGCGNGYYLDQLRGYLSINGVAAAYLGFDISKWAVRKGAIRNKNIRWIVADVKRPLLFQNETVSLLLNIFAPRNPPEFDRVLKPDGWVLCVIPTEDHLAFLREALNVMDIETEKYLRTINQFASHFKQVDTVKIEHPLSIDNPDHIIQLVKMTPFYLHMNAKKWAFIRNLSSYQDIFSCHIIMLKKG